MARAFYKVVHQALQDVNKLGVFPTKQPVLLVILQFFAEQKEYEKRDIDNMCKTMLAALKNILYEDDSQVKTIVVSKQLDKRIPANFVYVGTKIVSTSDDTGMVNASKRDALLLYKGAPQPS